MISVFDEPMASAPSDAKAEGETRCESIASPPVAVVDSVAVSQAISGAISPSTGENTKTDPDGNQPSDKSCSKSDGKPNCYRCKYRRALPGSAHSECSHPLIGDVDKLLTPMLLLQGRRSGAIKRLNISFDRHGVENGWFLWPLNYDPVWLNTCCGFTGIEGETR